LAVAAVREDLEEERLLRGATALRWVWMHETFSTTWIRRLRAQYWVHQWLRVATRLFRDFSECL